MPACVHCSYAERFFYIGPGGAFSTNHSQDKLLRYAVTYLSVA